MRLATCHAGLTSRQVSVREEPRRAQGLARVGNGMEKVIQASLRIAGCLARGVPCSAGIGAYHGPW